MKATNESYHQLLRFLMFFLIILQALPFLYYNHWLPDLVYYSNGIKLLTNFPNNLMWKGFYIFIVPVTMALIVSPGIGKKIKKEDQPKMKIYYWLMCIPILIGVIDHPALHYYNNFAYPCLFFLHMMFGSRGFTKIGNTMESEKPLYYTSQKPLELMGLRYEVINDYGVETYLHVHNPFQGILVEGGAGAGKSGSVIEPAIYQWVKDGGCQLIYDFKGNPATLGLFAYNAWKETPEVIEGIYRGKKVSWKRPEFYLLTFTELHLSVRVNPISPKILLNSMHTRSVTDTLAIAINRDWAKKRTDFWTGSALNLLHAIAERLRLNEELHPYCTLAHVIELACTDDFVALLNWIIDDSRTNTIVASFLTPLRMKADQQLAGQVSSLTTGLGSLKSPEIYWVFGAEPENQMSLDVNNPDEPKIISVSNDPIMAKALSPVLSCVIKSALTTMNQANKRPSAAPLDETPTIYIEDLSQIPATSRSNGLCTLLGIQDESQLKTSYDKQADEILSNMGNQFIGMTNNIDTAKKYAAAFGTFKMVDPSNSTSSESISLSERRSNEKIFQDRDVMEQPVGHFIGKIAGGEPAGFSVQFKEFEKSKHFKNWTDTMDIPAPDPFIRNLFEGDRDFANETFKSIMELNVMRIEEECQEILFPYKESQND